MDGSGLPGMGVHHQACACAALPNRKNQGRQNIRINTTWLVQFNLGIVGSAWAWLPFLLTIARRANPITDDQC